MNISNVPEGNVFSFLNNSTGKIQLAFRCKSIEFKQVVPVTIIKNYFLMDSDHLVFDICDVTDYESGVSYKQKTVISNLVPLRLHDVKPSRIIQLHNFHGSLRLCVNTKHESYNGKVIASLDISIGLPSNNEVENLGNFDTFNGIPNYTNHMRICPNCQNLSLTELKEDVPGFNVTCKCLFCANTISIKWKGD